MALTQISTAGVKDNAVTAGKIPANAVGSSELADNAVDTAAIIDGAVNGAKIAANAVGLAALADNAVDTNAIQNDAVTNAKMADNAVDDAVIAALAVTTPKIADDAVTAAKLANDAVISSNIVNGAVDSAKIADATIGLDKLVHGTSSNDGKFLRANNGADPTFETVNTDLSADSSPQLGGALDTNEHNIAFGDSSGTGNDRLKFGDGGDLHIYHVGGIGYIDDLVGSGDGVTIRAKNIRLQSNANVGAKSAVNCNQNAAVELFHNDVKQLETTENGILLPKGCLRGLGSSKVIIGGTLNPSQDVTWNFSFNTNDHGYNQGYIFNVKFYVNHWNTGSYYKYIESITGGRGNVTGMERVDLINNLGTGSASWSNGHLDYSVQLSGGTRDGSGAHLFKVTYDADGAPSYTSGYYLEVSYSSQIGTISIT